MFSADFRKKTRDAFESGVANESDMIKKNQEPLNSEARISQIFKISESGANNKKKIPCVENQKSTLVGGWVGGCVRLCGGR